MTINEIKYYRTDAANMLLGALYTSPALFDNPEITALSEADFPDKMHKIAYSVMHNLFSIGHSRFNSGVIQSYLSGRPQLSTFFNEKIDVGMGEPVAKGDYYFSKLAEVGDPLVFEPSFNMVKKMSLLRNLDRHGVSVSKFYDWDTTDSKVQAYQQTWIEKTDVRDIANEISEDIEAVMSSSSGSSATESFQAGDGLSALIQSFKEEPDFGMPSSISMMDSVTRGDRLGKFYLYSAPTGNGKSRIMMGRACNTAFPKLFNQKTRQWEDNGVAEGSLFISTELDKEECQTMALAFITGINEEIILDGVYNEDDDKIIAEGVKIMEESPMYYEIIPDFSVQEIESTIRKYYRENDVKYVRFDYIHTSMKFLAEISSISKGVNLREDQILFMLSTKFKDLANQLKIFIESGTQVNGDYLEGELTQNLLRGREILPVKSLSDSLSGLAKAS